MPKHLWFNNIRDSVIFIVVIGVLGGVLYCCYLIDKQKLNKRKNEKV